VLQNIRRNTPTGLFEEFPSLEEVERRYLEHILQEVGRNRTRAADVLGIDRRTLYRMAERYGIKLGDEPDNEPPCAERCTPSSATAPEFLPILDGANCPGLWRLCMDRPTRRPPT
jgi:hypothetical protein